MTLVLYSGSSLLPVTPPIGLPPMILDETNGWYLFGAANSDQVLFTISLTLSQPHNLHIVSSFYVVIVIYMCTSI